MKFIDLFSGIGGFRLALESLGLECVFSSEIDKFAKQTYKANFGIEPHGDITKIDSKDIPNHDILTAGFPCQAFSIAGKRRGFDDTRGTLFFEVARIIRDKQPKAFILENVPGLVSHEKGSTFQTIIDTLATTINGQKSFIETDNLGYHVYFGYLNSKDFGVAQNRKRIFIVGFRDSINFRFPGATNSNVKLKDILESEVHEKYYLSEKQINSLISHAKNQKEKGNSFSSKIITRENLNSPTLTTRYFMNSQFLLDENIIIGKDLKPKRNQDIASCLTVGGHSGGNHSDMDLLLSSTGIRRLTPRECAKLQGFLESYKIVCSDSQAYKQFGNSVTVNVIQAIAKNVLDSLFYYSQKVG